MGSERLRRDERLRVSADYLRCYRKGRRRNGTRLLLYSFPNGLGHFRIGFTASRKVGNAVARQRTKRRLREIFRRSRLRASVPACDLVVHLQPASGGTAFGDLRLELEGLLARVAQVPVQASPQTSVTGDGRRS